ncbi:MAG: aspartyl protease family protein [Firmicutes bacterium]|nr:aspartyl protease family protein [Bacillota bacterium]
MKKLAIVLIMVFGLLIAPVFSQEPKINIPAPLEKDCVVKFDLARHFIIVKVRMGSNGKEKNFIFDTGVNVNIVDPSALEGVNSVKVGEAPVTDTTDTKGKMGVFVVESMSLGNCMARNEVVSTTDLSLLSKMTGIKIDGLLGDNFIRNYRVTIDYKTKTLILSNDTKPVTGKYVIKADGRPPFTTITLKGKDGGDPGAILQSGSIGAIIDTGAYDVYFPYPAIENLKLDKGRFITGKGSMTGGLLGKSSKDIAADIPSMTIGGVLEIKDHPVLSNQSEKALVGYVLLSRFHVVLDYPAGMIILTPYENEKTDTNIHSFGMGLLKNEKGEATVTGVWIGAQADKAGIEPGDIISEINGKMTTSYTQNELSNMMMDDTIRKIKVKVNGKKNTFETTLERKPLFE